MATVCATLALLALGSIVTTFRVGMADPIWPTYPWHLLLISYDEPQPGFLIEHTHRLAGYIVGCLIIVLAVGLWRTGQRWLRLLGVTALAAVIVQGLLGGFRVKLHALVGTDLALIHGCFAQIVFGLLVGLAVFTSRGWCAAPAADSPALRRWSLAAAGLIYLQIVFGAWIRHTGSPFGQRLHVLLAFGVVAAATGLLCVIFTQQPRDRRLTGPATLLAALLMLQIMLGLEAWIMRTAAGWMLELQPLTVRQAIIRTAHVLVGSLTFATAMVLTLRAHRSVWVPAPERAPLHSLEGAA